jgi:FkbM family methyltransferase
MAMAPADTKIVATRHGPMMGLAGDLYITRALEVYGEYCPGEWRMLAQLVKPGMTVVEMGANIGTHSVPLAHQCFPGPLYLFEPQQRVFQLLCANLAANSVRNAIAYPEACSEAEGFVLVPRLDYGANLNFGGVSVQADGEGASGQRVRATPLDSLNLPACHVIKIDVEGFEALALRGAAATIRRFRPVLYVENDRKDRQNELITLIAEMGYKLYWHRPRLFEPGNFNGYPDDIFGRVISRNMLCIPAERGTTVLSMEAIDPKDWQVAPG